MKCQTLVAGLSIFVLALAGSDGCKKHSTSGGADDGGTEDAGLDGGGGLCGDNVVDPNEECDDGNNVDDDECRNDCTWACGDGLVQPHETCDTAIPAGQTGACPTDCEDFDACTTDTLSGSECQTECVHGAVTVIANDDGCCPPAGNANNDNDCSPVCGNNVLEAGETCDPTSNCPTTCDDQNPCTLNDLTGSAAACTAACSYPQIVVCNNDDGCCPPGCNVNNDNDCTTVCGNSVLEPGETCDPTPTCPTTCNDFNDCTTDSMSGAAATCNVACTNTPIVNCIHNDLCCPAGCNNVSDNDCSATCGNNVVETGETCDPPADCPQTCADTDPCTIDSMTGSPANCNVVCTHTAITTPIDNDGCCPTGANANTDNDCPPVCGNNAVEPGETCDPPADCPQTCADTDPCTTDSMSGDPSTCDVVCSHTAITTCDDNDGCCPATCNAVSDNDCPSVCGNGVVEPGETCDDGDTDPGDGCDENCQIETGPTVFRISEMYLRDPHTYLQLLWCSDVTDNVIIGDSTNDTLNINITTDEDNDGYLDLSLIIVFRPLDQVSAGGNCDVGSALCTAPMSSTVCDVDPQNPLTATTFTNQSSGTCLAPYPGTTYGPYSPEITNPTAPCFSTGMVSMTLNLAGVPVTLQNTQVGATYVGNPAGTLVNGLVRGFITEADAELVEIDLGGLGIFTLNELLPGGQGCCANHDDRDENDTGWWFYLNFEAEEVAWNGP